MAGRWSFMNPQHLSGNLLLIQERFLLGKDLSQLDRVPSHSLLSCSCWLTFSAPSPTEAAGGVAEGCVPWAGSQGTEDGREMCAGHTACIPRAWHPHGHAGHLGSEPTKSCEYQQAHDCRDGDGNLEIW